MPLDSIEQLCPSENAAANTDPDASTNVPALLMETTSSYCVVSSHFGCNSRKDFKYKPRCIEPQEICKFNIYILM